MAVDQDINNLQLLTKSMTQPGEKYLITFYLNVESCQYVRSIKMCMYNICTLVYCSPVQL
jgi:hypothetical protein